MPWLPNDPKLLEAFNALAADHPKSFDKEKPASENSYRESLLEAVAQVEKHRTQMDRPLQKPHSESTTTSRQDDKQDSQKQFAPRRS